MNRRQLFGGAIAAPAIIAATAASAGSRDRISCERGDPGEVRYGELCADGMTVKVFLDGREIDHCVMADPGLGVVKRARTSPKGNIVMSGDQSEILYEELRGVVSWTAVPL